MMKVLHVTSWYPNKYNSKEALWIQRHIEALEEHVDDYFVLHIKVKSSGSFSSHIGIKDSKLKEVIIELPTQTWFFIELVAFFILIYQLFKLQINKRFSIINFHIAYPLLTYWHLIKRWVKIPILITEHWSAYHFNFGVEKKNRLKRVKRIFRQGIPIICVSEALKNDVQKFANFPLPNVFVIPNIVEINVFNHKSTESSLKDASYSFFMVSGWKWPKKPNIVIEAFAQHILSSKDKCYLRIGGYGTLLEEMAFLVKKLNIADRVIFLGKLNSWEIAREMSQAAAFLHCSEYETFSVVCAEALCSGCPVIASNVGGIGEFVHAKNGILIEENSKDHWAKALNLFLQSEFDRASIAKEASESFSSFKVGKRYYKVLEEVIDGFNR